MNQENDRGTVLRIALEQSIHDLNIRGLRLSAKWSSEQLAGLPRDYKSMQSTPIRTATICDESISNLEYSSILLANTLILNGEYQRCAHLLRIRNGNTTSLPSSRLGKFLSLYSLYMAGEKIKEQLISESPDSKSESAKNPFLSEVVKDLLPLYAKVRRFLYHYRNIIN